MMEVFCASGQTEEHLGPCFCVFRYRSILIPLHGDIWALLFVMSAGVVGRLCLLQFHMLTYSNEPNLSRIVFVGVSPSAELASVWTELMQN